MLKTWKFKLVFWGVSDHSFSRCSVEHAGDTGHSSAGFLHILVPNASSENGPREWAWQHSGFAESEQGLACLMKETFHQAAEILCIVKGVLLSLHYLTRSRVRLLREQSCKALMAQRKHSDCSVSEHFCWGHGPELSDKMLYYSLIVRASQIKCAL